VCLLLFVVFVFFDLIIVIRFDPFWGGLLLFPWDSLGRGRNGGFHHLSISAMLWALWVSHFGGPVVATFFLLAGLQRLYPLVN
jgi:hypothetical protein